MKNYKIHPNVVLGKNVKIMDYSIIGMPTGSSEEPNHPTIIGDNSIIGSHAIIYEGVKIGNNFKCGHNVVIEKDCEIGNGCFIGNGAVLRPGTKIGNNSVFSHLSVSEGHNKIGNNTTIQSQCHITLGAVIEDNVFIAPFFCGANTKRISHGRNYPVVIEPFHIKKGCRIGIGVIVLPDITIGVECFIGMGALVTHDIPDYKIVYGSPARIIKDVPQNERLKWD